MSLRLFCCFCKQQKVREASGCCAVPLLTLECCRPFPPWLRTLPDRPCGQSLRFPGLRTLAECKSLASFLNHRAQRRVWCLLRVKIEPLVVRERVRTRGAIALGGGLEHRIGPCLVLALQIHASATASDAFSVQA